MNATEVEPQKSLGELYHELLREVEFECSLCEAIHEDIGVLNSKMRRLYDWVRARTKSDRQHEALLNNWKVAFYLASDIRQAVCFKKQEHQVCGIDSSTVDEIYAAIKERFEFLTGQKIEACE